MADRRSGGPVHDGAAPRSDDDRTVPDAPDAVGVPGDAGTRAVAPAVGKVLELGLVVVYVGLLATALFGGVVPDYRTATGDAVAERTAAAAAQRVQQAVPPRGRAVRARVRVRIPATIRGSGYDVAVRNRTLVVDHPHPAVVAEARMALPPAVVSVDGRWRSTRPAVVAVRSVPGGLAVRLRPGGTP